jgi:hypothetical protein
MSFRVAPTCRCVSTPKSENQQQISSLKQDPPAGKRRVREFAHGPPLSSVTCWCRRRRCGAPSQLSPSALIGLAFGDSPVRPIGPYRRDFAAMALPPSHPNCRSKPTRSKRASAKCAAGGSSTRSLTVGDMAVDGEGAWATRHHVLTQRPRPTHPGPHRVIASMQCEHARTQVRSNGQRRRIPIGPHTEFYGPTGHEKLRL